MSSKTESLDYGITKGVSVPAFARHLGVNRKTIERLIEMGEGPRVVAIRHPTGRVTRRITKDDAIRWLRARTVEAG